MGDFNSKDEFVEVLGRVLTLMSTDAEMGPRLRAANTAQKFVFPDQNVVVNITAAPDDQDDGNNLVWVLSDDIEWEPEVVMTMDTVRSLASDVNHDEIKVALKVKDPKEAGALP